MLLLKLGLTQLLAFNLMKKGNFNVSFVLG